MDMSAGGDRHNDSEKGLVPFLHRWAVVTIVALVAIWAIVYVAVERNKEPSPDHLAAMHGDVY